MLLRAPLFEGSIKLFLGLWFKQQFLSFLCNHLIQIITLTCFDEFYKQTVKPTGWRKFTYYVISETQLRFGNQGQKSQCVNLPLTQSVFYVHNRIAIMVFLQKLVKIITKNFGHLPTSSIQFRLHLYLSSCPPSLVLQ